MTNEYLGEVDRELFAQELVARGLSTPYNEDQYLPNPIPSGYPTIHPARRRLELLDDAAIMRDLTIAEEEERMLLEERVGLGSLPLPLPILTIEGDEAYLVNTDVEELQKYHQRAREAFEATQKD